MGPLSAGILAGGSLLGGLMGKKKSMFGLGTSYRRARRDATALQKAWKAQLTDQTAREQELIRSATKKSLGGIDAAKREMALAENQAIRGALERGAVDQARIKTQGGGSGLSETSALSQHLAEGGRASDQRLADIRVKAGESFGELELTRSALGAAGDAALAQSTMRHFANQNILRASELSAKTGLNFGGGQVMNWGGGGSGGGGLDLSGLYMMMDMFGDKDTAGSSGGHSAFMGGLGTYATPMME